MSHLIALPDALIVAILRHCDEPTRDRTASVSRAMTVHTAEARIMEYAEAAKRPGRWTREPLPTYEELRARGCPTPNRANIAKTMGVSLQNRASAGSLTRIYGGAQALATAQAAGCTQIENKGESTYEGGSREGRNHGFGIWTSTIGVYLGGWNAGQMAGSGFWARPSGERYEGEFSNGKRHGYGCQVWDEGYRYEGDWVNNARSGYGISISPLGEQYKGDYQDGYRHGHGTCVNPVGEMYVGAWCDGHWHGAGLWTAPTGERYEGTFVGGLREGRGTWTGANGDGYFGKWQANRFDGHGAWRGADGESYVGNFAAGRRHGRGRLIDKDGAQSDVVYREGACVSLTHCAPRPAPANA